MAPPTVNTITATEKKHAREMQSSEGRKTRTFAEQFRAFCDRDVLREWFHLNYTVLTIRTTLQGEMGSEPDLHGLVAHEPHVHVGCERVHAVAGAHTHLFELLRACIQYSCHRWNEGEGRGRRIAPVAIRLNSWATGFAS